MVALLEKEIIMMIVLSSTTIKLANSASPSKFCQVKFQQKTGLENDKISFSQRETEYN